MSSVTQKSESDLRLAAHAASEDLLLKRYAESRSDAIEAELVDRFMPLARSLAMRYRGGAESSEDLMQVASLALVKAIRGFDPERGRRFPAYAAPTILGEIRRHFRDHSWRLHMPRRLQEDSMRVDRVSSDLSDELGTAPTVAQIAERAGMDEEDVLDVLQAKESQRSVSLDTPVDTGEPDSAPMIERMGELDGGFDTVEAQIAIESCAALDERERKVLHLRFAEDLNQYEIGTRLGVSQMQVSRIMRRALAKLLEAVQGSESPDGIATFEDDSPDPRFPNGRSRRRGPRAPAD